MDTSTEISSGIGTPENPYEIVFDFDGQNYSWNSFNMISEYIKQGITDMKLQYSVAGHWVDAKEFTYDLSTSNAYAMGTLENPIMYGGYLETPVSSPFNHRLQSKRLFPDRRTDGERRKNLHRNGRII